MITQLFNSGDPVTAITSLLVRICAVLLCITIHEFAHGYTAFLLGDVTARNQGRLSLSPLAHLDPIGFICMLIAGIGWAKPVPVNPGLFRMRNKKLGMAITAAAGPLSNFITSFICLLIMYPVLNFGHGNFARAIIDFLWMIALMGLGLGVFNLIPIPPLDGSKVLMLVMPNNVIQWVWRNEGYIRFAFLLLVFFGGFSTAIGVGMNFLLGRMSTAVFWIYSVLGIL